jgi:hypothetical protein
LAFWHADLLCRLSTLERIARLFDSLKDGEVAAVHDMGGRRNLFRPTKHRYWELIGCTTRGASRDQFEKGAGWWRNFANHPNCPSAEERERRKHYFWDSGGGIVYWKRRYKGVVKDIKLRDVEEGHCTSINRPNYVRLAQDTYSRNLPAELDMNYSLDEVAERLGISHLLDA